MQVDGAIYQKFQHGYIKSKIYKALLIHFITLNLYIPDRTGAYSLFLYVFPRPERAALVSNTPRPLLVEISQNDADVDAMDAAKKALACLPEEG